MFKRILIVGGLSLTGIVGLSATAGAQSTDPRCYPVVTATCPAAVTIDDTTATPGQTLTATATGLDPNTTASAVANSTPVNLGSKTTSATGSVSFSFTVPADFENGAHSIVVTGVKNGAATTLTTNFTVSGAAGGVTTTTTRSQLPRTGSDSNVPLTQLGIGLLAVGGGAVYVAKRRKAASAA